MLFKTTGPREIIQGSVFVKKRGLWTKAFKIFQNIFRHRFSLFHSSPREMGSEFPPPESRWAQNYFNKKNMMGRTTSDIQSVIIKCQAASTWVDGSVCLGSPELSYMKSHYHAAEVMCIGAPAHRTSYAHLPVILGRVPDQCGPETAILPAS